MLTQINRYSIKHILILVTLFAVFSAALMNESEWWRAWLATLTSGAVINALLCGIFSKGERRAFAIGYVVTAFYCIFSLYMVSVSIPYLLTKLLWEYVEMFSTSPPDEDHFYIVAGLFWGNLFAYCGALVALRWYRKTQAEQQEQED
ncbi:MAG: hypothetical protein COA78_12960 [Blastopirellula sp.]|nr:MAG: hypothetical protein COA78_12960 [Blastopirellula sp.]